MKRFIFLLLLPLALTGCSWHGELSKDFYQPTSNYTKKANVIIGVVPNPDNPPRKISYSSMVTGELDISNVGDAVAKRLQTYYTDVRKIESFDDCPECDAFAVYTLNVSMSQAVTHVNYTAQLILDFANKKIEPITTLQSRYQGTVGPKPHTFALSFITGFSLFTLSPITMPAIAASYVSAMNEEVIAATTSMLNGMGHKIRNNKLLTEKALKGKVVKTNNKKAKAKMNPVQACIASHTMQYDDGTSDARSIASGVAQACKSVFMDDVKQELGSRIFTIEGNYEKAEKILEDICIENVLMFRKEKRVLYNREILRRQRQIQKEIEEKNKRRNLMEI